MGSFFASIRGYFKGEYEGRYFSILLRELAQHEPESFRRLLVSAVGNSHHPAWDQLWGPLKNGEIDAALEQSFSGSSKRRRADVALLHHGTIVGLLEIKEFDRLNPTNSDQLADYLRHAANAIPFIHVHRFLPVSHELKKLRKAIDKGHPVALLSYNQIHKSLEDSAPDGRALGALVRNYLEDIGVGVYKEIGKSDRRAISFLLAQMLGFPHKAGMGKLQSEHSVRRGPQLIAAFLGNMEVVGEWVRKPNEPIMRTRTNTRFWINPWLNHRKVKKGLDVSKGAFAALPEGFTSYVGGGEVAFVANVAIRNGHMHKNDYLHLEMGICIELKTGDKVPRFYAYSQFNSRGLQQFETQCVSGPRSTVPDELGATKLFRGLIEGSRKIALSSLSGPKKTLVKKMVLPD